jgi:hypothetical protein
MRRRTRFTKMTSTPGHSNRPSCCVGSARSENELDLEHIAEEIEDLGRGDLRAAQSLCEHVIEHFLKLEYSGIEQAADHWRDEIVEWRLHLEKTLTRSIEAKLDMPSRYRAALRLLRRFERDVPELMSRLPRVCPYTLEQILSNGDEDWFPEPRAHHA